ncbi:unnamed protein product [Nippostrongylus brasiliensis]|uniref:Secreted protein n=1 Tax=Nippostrongylus brasiliensis TaxID=27835 RepID=A0A0N4YAD8_NIPBR|nr:unnamed protein product [Nippostrongylus brasiliensis]
MAAVALVNRWKPNRSVFVSFFTALCVWCRCNFWDSWEMEFASPPVPPDPPAVVVGAAVVGASVVGASVVGASVVGAAVVGCVLTQREPSHVDGVYTVQSLHGCPVA